MNHDTTDPRHTRIWALSHTLRGHGFTVEVDADDPAALTITADITADIEADKAPITIRCDVRGSDAGRLWFYFPGEYPPIAPADDAHLMDVVVAVKGKVAR